MYIHCFLHIFHNTISYKAVIIQHNIHSYIVNVFPNEFDFNYIPKQIFQFSKTGINKT